MNSPLDEATEENVDAARDWVLRLASGDISADDMDSFKAWLAHSPSNREAFERERLFWQRLGGLKAASGPATWEAETPAIRPPAMWSPARRRTIFAGALAAACVALLAVIGGIDVIFASDYRTGAGEQREVTLPDGSIVHLDTDTAIEIAFGDDERRVDLLRGQALFEVVTDPRRPFRVAAAGGSTQALGTAFIVRTDGDAGTVTVTEGTVGVTSPAESDSAASTVRAERGQRTSYRKGMPPRPSEPVDVAATTLWRDGVIRIEDLPLGDAIAELDRYRPGRIVLMGEAAAYRSVSGAFDIGNIDAAIAGLAATHRLRVIEITPYLLVLR